MAVQEYTDESTLWFYMHTTFTSSLNKGVVKMSNKIMLVAILILVACNITLCVYTLAQVDKVYKRIDTVFYIVSDDAEENYKLHKAINSKLVEIQEKLP